IQNAREWGVLTADSGAKAAIDMPVVLARKDKIVAGLAKGVEFLFKRNKIDWIKGTARLTGNGGVDVFEGDKQTLRARREIIVATGSTPRGVPGIEIDRKRIITSDEAIGLSAVPKTLVIMGSGAVGVEFASIFNRFGSDVTVVELLPRLVPVEDEAVSAELEKSFRKQGITSHTGAKVTAAERIAGQASRPINYDHVPGCTYCDPEIGSVGLTEAEAKARGFDVRVGTFPFGVLGRAKMAQETDGFVKIVADKKYDELLGVHMIGPRATELVAEATVALRLEATVEELIRTIHAHPTMAEAIGEAAHAAHGAAIH